MREPQARTIHLKDYTPPAFKADTVELDVEIRKDDAIVSAKLAMRRNAAGPLVLDGDEVELVSVKLDGGEVRYELTPERLTIHDAPDRFTLETVSRIVPQKNTKLKACTRRRTASSRNARPRASAASRGSSTGPDVMAKYTTTVRADGVIPCCCRTATSSPRR